MPNKIPLIINVRLPRSEYPRANNPIPIITKCAVIDDIFLYYILFTPAFVTSYVSPSVGTTAVTPK